LSTTPRRLDEEAALRAVVEGTASETGENFYRALVNNLADTLDTHGAWLTEYLEGTGFMRALAFRLGNRLIDDFTYKLAGTPCEVAILESRVVHIPDRITELYPDQPEALQKAGIVSYLGAPLLAADGKVLGHLAVIDNRPIPPEKRFLDLFQIFANRALAEVRRLRLEQDLREGRESLSILIDSAMDAIIELDADLRITLLNTAAQRLFATSGEAVSGREMACLLGDEASGKLSGLAKELAGRSEGNPYLWIPDGLAASPPGGPTFRAEATLSRFERNGATFYTLILRNVEDRIQAERKIRDLTAQTKYLREEIEADHGFQEIIGRSRPLREALKAVVQVAATDATVLITGETGTGKEVFARAIHDRSPRKDRPIVKVNCAAIPAALIESEFFGHEKGAFTGATQRREGRFALADGGTIFLDEIGELPLELQGKLLRVLQEGEFEPVGGSRTRKVDVRVLAATNRDLKAAMESGAFREDLYYRLAVFPLHLPPLRERGEDVVLLASAMLDRMARRLGRRPEALSEEDVRSLRAHSWPGNIRELRNLVERALITSRGEPVRIADLLSSPGTGKAAPAEEPGAEPTPGTLREILTEDQVRDFQRENMVAALHRCDGRVGGRNGAAELLGISPSTFKSRMKAMGIQPEKGVPHA
jgi:PAS domain S-box-containing protein